MDVETFAVATVFVEYNSDSMEWFATCIYDEL